MTTTFDPLLFRPAPQGPSSRHSHGRTAHLARPAYPMPRTHPARSPRASHHAQSVRARASSAARQSELSIIIRRRLVVAVVALVAFVSVFAVLNSVVSADGSNVNHSEVPRTIIAQPGDTIWAIARRVMPEGNINSLVDQLVKLNGATITVGQSIRIP